ncbi:hypothetical protein HGA91_04150 [candidate division WWE3 bacterium]|nr:hypothetical protein [candidate division WWE3 bacterium]
MSRKVIIVHRWEGTPEADWYPWVHEQLTQSGYVVEIPEMPNTQAPDISEWIRTLHRIIPVPDERITLIGHSIGSQAILRYLATFFTPLTLGGVILVTPWLNLTQAATQGVEQIAAPWLTTPINMGRIRSHRIRYTAIFSDNDPFVPITDAEIFRYQLGAKIVVEKSAGHMTTQDNIVEVPSVLEAVFSA